MKDVTDVTQLNNGLDLAVHARFISNPPDYFRTRCRSFSHRCYKP